MYASQQTETDAVGVVVIGRNEGQRLRLCLASLQGAARSVVYVDSGSADGSAALALSMGVEVVELDMGTPFTAARARNAGFERLVAAEPGLRFVQFIDGDCQMRPGWTVAAAAFLGLQTQVAVVSGRLRERHPDASVYNQLCDLEWDTPLGSGLYCGGICMIRAEAFRAVGGFRAGLIAGEEPELCVRLRAAGWLVWRIDNEMALHDAAMTRFGQWWRRSVRSGYAFAEGAALHGAAPARHWVRETRSALAWGAGVPAAVLVGWLALGPMALLALLIYPTQAARLFISGSGPARVRAWRAFFLVVGKFPEAVGQFKFHVHRAGAGRSGLIEHK